MNHFVIAVLYFTGQNRNRNWNWNHQVPALVDSCLALVCCVFNFDLLTSSLSSAPGYFLQPTSACFFHVFREPLRGCTSGSPFVHIHHTCVRSQWMALSVPNCAPAASFCDGCSVLYSRFSFSISPAAGLGCGCAG